MNNTSKKIILTDYKNYKKFKSFQSDLRNNLVITSLQEGEFHALYPNITVYIDKIFKDGKLSNLLIHDTRNKDYESTIIAKEGKISNLSEKQPITLRIRIIVNILC